METKINRKVAETAKHLETPPDTVEEQSATGELDTSAIAPMLEADDVDHTEVRSKITHDTSEALEAIVREATSQGVRPVQATFEDTAEYLEADQRRTVMKTMRPMSDVNMAAKVVGEAMAAPEAPELYMFLSKHPKLTIYVDLGQFSYDRNGQRVVRHTKVDFNSGFFQTKDAKLAAAIKAHPRCNRGMFREAPSQEAAMMYRAARAAQDGLRSSAQAGVSTALQGNDTTFLNQTAQLDNVAGRVWGL